MKINGFGLYKYRKTRGREGEGYTAILTYNSKAVASYEDYATGALPTIIFEESGHGKDEMLSMMAYIDSVLHPPYLDKDDVESCARTLFEMLDEGRDIDQMFRSAKKDSASQQFVLLILSGHTWAMALAVDGPIEIGQLYSGSFRNSAAMDYKTLVKKAHCIISEMLKRGDIKHCTGFIVLDSQRSVPLVLTTTEYIEIFSGARVFDERNGLLD